MTKEQRRRVSFLIGRRFKVSLRVGPKNGYFGTCEIRKVVHHMEGDVGFHLYVNLHQINEGMKIGVSDFICKNDKKYSGSIRWQASHALREHGGDCELSLHKLLMYVGVPYEFICISRVVHVTKDYFT